MTETDRERWKKTETDRCRQKQTEIERDRNKGIGRVISRSTKSSDRQTYTWTFRKREAELAQGRRRQIKGDRERETNRGRQ